MPEDIVDRLLKFPIAEWNDARLEILNLRELLTQSGNTNLVKRELPIEAGIIPPEVEQSDDPKVVLEALRDSNINFNISALEILDLKDEIRSLTKELDTLKKEKETPAVTTDSGMEYYHTSLKLRDVISNLEAELFKAKLDFSALTEKYKAAIIDLDVFKEKVANDPGLRKANTELLIMKSEMNNLVAKDAKYQELHSQLTSKIDTQEKELYIANQRIETLTSELAIEKAKSIDLGNKLENKAKPSFFGLKSFFGGNGA